MSDNMIPPPKGSMVAFAEGWQAQQAGRNKQTNPYAAKRMGKSGPVLRLQWAEGYAASAQADVDAARTPDDLAPTEAFLQAKDRRGALANTSAGDKAEPTPGEWVIVPTFGQMRETYCQPFAIIQRGQVDLIAGFFGDVPGGTAVAKANARLGAAAKDLLETGAAYWAAVDARREFEREHPNDSSKRWDALLYAIEDAETAHRAAIVKATGR